jgi:hypothetical protein
MERAELSFASVTALAVPPTAAGQTIHAVRPIRQKNEPGTTRAPGNSIIGRRSLAGSARPAYLDGRSHYLRHGSSLPARLCTGWHECR